MAVSGVIAFASENKNLVSKLRRKMKACEGVGRQLFFTS